ncbi:4-hydroxybenzoate decarboxylase subunit C [Planctomycetales bacterium 10988]|nr:4-hydroxybenzoate decarboxylase subunit C [Planctomycetales bacterium 10988]
MGYRNLEECVEDLEKVGELIRIEAEVDPYLEAAEIQRRVFQAEGPAIYFANLKGCQFPAVGNLYGTMKRMRYLFRDTLESVQRLVALKIDPAAFKTKPWRYFSAGTTAWTMLPKKVRRGPILSHQTTIDQLPQIQSWPDDGGAFITLPQVYTENVDKPGMFQSNLGMYRVQLGGNDYEQNKEIGLHYQIHRGIGVHHAAALKRGESFRVNIFVGGPPVMALSAVMPLPEGLPELFFAGALGGRRVRLVQPSGKLPMPAEADFCIVGRIDPQQQKPEGPFGDHLGYYSLIHDFPVMQVEAVYHRPNAIWPFTSVGRPPQEDTMFGEIIHEITGPAIPSVITGVKAVHAVDAAGVHPLLLAIGSERYVPYQPRRRPQELLTQANAILGQGQLSLAKYLLIIAEEDQPDLNIHHIDEFLQHLLKRIDWRRDLHFQTCTTIDTLDYSGSGLNEGSKVVWAAVGEKQRELPTTIEETFTLPDNFKNPKVCLPGVLAIEGPPYQGSREEPDQTIEKFCQQLDSSHPVNQFPLIIIVEDSDFASQNLNNFLWVTFTRSNPASDIYGIEAKTFQKHWGCRGSLVIDARYKTYMAPPLLEDPDVSKRVESLATKGGPLHGIL